MPITNWSPTNWLPDFKGALVGFYDERLKGVIEDKNIEYKSLLAEHIAYGKKTQKVLVAIALATLLLITIYCFWKD